MEKRLKKRHNQLVESYMSSKQRATNGLKLLLKDTKPFSQVQASWRFLNNDNVTTEVLFKPIFNNLKKRLPHNVINLS